MPLIIDRRSFLKQTAAAALIPFSLKLRADQANIRVALLADTHISADPSDKFRGFSPHQNLHKTVDQVAAAGKFDMLVVNGDLARQKGEPDDYVKFNSFLGPLAEQMPVALTLGNHDDRKNARSALIKRAGEVEPVEQKLISTVDAGPFQFLMLDSLLVTNIAPGQLGKSQRQWLGEYLGAHGSKPAIVFVHHNPDPDGDNALVDAERLLAILKPRRSVKALIFGHTHVYAFDKQDGLHLINLPAVGYNFADGQPVGWMEGAFSSGGVDLKLHAIAGDTKDDGKAVSLAWR
jgi:3',5'-cyclic-AMP phosphodiesterase